MRARPSTARRAPRTPRRRPAPARMSLRIERHHRERVRERVEECRLGRSWWPGTRRLADLGVGRPCGRGEQRRRARIGDHPSASARSAARTGLRLAAPACAGPATIGRRRRVAASASQRSARLADRPSARTARSRSSSATVGSVATVTTRGAMAGGHPPARRPARCGRRVGRRLRARCGARGRVRPAASAAGESPRAARGRRDASSSGSPRTLPAPGPLASSSTSMLRCTYQRSSSRRATMSGRCRAATRTSRSSSLRRVVRFSDATSASSSRP